MSTKFHQYATNVHCKVPEVAGGQSEVTGASDLHQAKSNNRLLLLLLL